MENYLGQDVSTVGLVRRQLVDANQRLEEFDNAIEFDLQFVGDMQHYDREDGTTERATYRIKPKDPSIFRVWRYKLETVLKRFPVVVETRPPRRMPLDPMALAQSKMAKHAIEEVISDPFRGYDRVRRQVVGGALMARAWAAGLNYDQRFGLMFDDYDPRRVRWAAGFKHMHHPLNPWVIVLARMTVSQCKSMVGAGWKVPDDLQGDDPALSEGIESASDSPYGTPSSAPSERAGEDAIVTVAIRWSRFEKGFKADLKPGERWMQCVNKECGFMTPPEAEAQVEEYEPGVLAGCPQCQGDMIRVNQILTDKRLLICAPFSGWDKPFVEDRWTFDYPTFPILWYEAYPLPHQPIGQSDSSLLRTTTIATNAMTRLGYETMLRSKPYYVARGELFDAWGGVFAFQEENGDLIFPKDEWGKVEVVQGQGPNAALFAMIDRLQAQFRTNESTSEMAMTPEQLKEAKVGAMEIASETGNVVIDGHGAQLYDAETLFFACVAQALRELPSKPVRMQDQNGAWMYERMGGSMMPDVEVRVGAGAKLSTLDLDEIDAFMKLSALLPPVRRVYAQIAHIDPEVLTMLDEAEREAGIIPGMPPPGAPGAPPPPGQGAPRSGRVPPPEPAGGKAGAV